MKELKVFAGCTEFGSEVQAFKDRGHDVVTLGLEGDVGVKKDIRDFHTTKHYDFMIFHPPCTEFSIANHRLGACKNRNPDMSIVEACFRIVNEAKPTFWIIENPRGCLRYFIGKPQATIKYSDFGYVSIKPTDLWGDFPMFTYYTPNDHPKPFIRAMPGFTKQQRAQRSVIPYNLSMCLCVAIEITCNGYNKNNSK